MEAHLQSHQRQQPHDPFRKRFIWHSYCRHALLHPHIKHFLYFFFHINQHADRKHGDRASLLHSSFNSFMYFFGRVHVVTSQKA